MSTNSSIQGNAGNLKQEGKQVIHAAATSPLMEKLIRLGYVARGLIWGVIGLLAFQVAVGSGGKHLKGQVGCPTIVNGRQGLAKYSGQVTLSGLPGANARRGWNPGRQH